MESYCTKCGEKLRSDALFCTHCGQRISAPAHTSDEWTVFGDFLSFLSLGFANMLLYLIMGGIVLAFGAGGAAALAIGVNLLFRSATGGFCTLPPSLAASIGIESLNGVFLALSGVKMIFIALLLFLVVISIIRGMFTRRNRNK